MKTVPFIIVILCLAAAARAQEGVTINGVTWAASNIGEPGQIAELPEEYGHLFTFEEAQSVCPPGWRTPTREEFETLLQSPSEWETVDNVPGRRFGSGYRSIFLPAAGFRYTPDGSLGGQQIGACYWSAEPDPNNANIAWYLHIGSSDSYYMDSTDRRAYAFSVRCVRESEPAPAPQGVTIDGVTWARANVGARGKFMDNPWDEGFHYTGNDAQTACPAGWRLPTREEWENLARTDSKWTPLNGVNGRRFGSEDRSIFLPAAGTQYYTDGSRLTKGAYGRYWSSASDRRDWSAEQLENNPSGTWYLRFWANGSDLMTNYDKQAGFSVRCVRE